MTGCGVGILFDTGIPGDPKSFYVLSILEWKMFQLSTICRKESGRKIFTFSYGLTTLVGEKFIDYCCLRLRQMVSKTYHSVARNKTYKAIPSFLIPHPPLRWNTSNRFPYLPFIFQGKRPKKNTTFRKVNKIGGSPPPPQFLRRTAVVINR
jgi:hypothetical protein